MSAGIGGLCRCARQHAPRALLKFAAIGGTKVDEDVRNALVATEAAVEIGTATLEQEQLWLKSYERLTTTLAPITVETLDASTTKLPSLRGHETRINDPLRGRFSRFSLDALVDIAAALGQRVSVASKAA